MRTSTIIPFTFLVFLLLVLSFTTVPFAGEKVKFSSIDGLSPILNMPSQTSSTQEADRGPCHWETYCPDENISFLWPLPSTRTGHIACAQRFTATYTETLMQVSFYVYDYDYGGIPFGDDDIVVSIYDDDGTGLPGDLLAESNLPFGSYPADPTPTIADFSSSLPAILVTGDFHVAISIIPMPGPDPGEVIFCDDGNYGTERSSVLYEGTGWVHVWDDINFELDYNFAIKVQMCQAHNEQACVSDGNWPTMGRTDQRENRSLSSAGDIQCELKKSWTYVLDDFMTDSSPIIYNDTIVAYLRNNLVALDLNTGAEIWKRPLNDVELAGGNGTAIIPNIRDGVIFVGSGSSGDNFSALSLNDGTTIWTEDGSNHMSYAPSVILNIASDVVIFYADDYGDIHARRTSDGSDYYDGTGGRPNLGNPFFRTSCFVQKAFTTDGTNLYIGSDEFPQGAANLYCIDAATGSEVWDFVNDGAGFQLQNVIPDEYNSESIRSAMAFEEVTDGDDIGRWLYFATCYWPTNGNNCGGLMYAVNADNGSLKWVARASGYDVEFAAGGVVLDRNQVIYGMYQSCGEAGDTYGPTSYNKKTGAINWTKTATNPHPVAAMFAPGLLTCENYEHSDAPDWLIYSNSFNYLNFVNATSGEVIWHRRTVYDEYNYNFTNGPIMGDNQILFCDLDKLHCLTNQGPRQRLHLPSVDLSADVSLDQGSSVQHTFPNAITNSGCADLQIFGITIDTDDNGTHPPVPYDFKKSRGGAGGFPLFDRMLDDDGDNATNSMVSTSRGLPGFINGVVSPTPGTMVSPGDTIPIILDINTDLAPTEHTAIFAYIDTDDPDYFLDSAYMDDNVNYAIPSTRLTLLVDYICIDPDGDGYGSPDYPETDCELDNCPSVYNEDQTNNDNDDHGNACDNCPDITNNNQDDFDADTLGDACDNCPSIDNNDQANDDGDIKGNVCDNCPFHANDDQLDGNSDGVGDACTFEQSTPTGTDVPVDLSSDVDMQFDNVTTGGTTEMTVTTTGPTSESFQAVPSDPPMYYNFTTTSTFTGNIEICITYDDTDLTQEQEDALTLQHFNGTDWIDITSSLNTTTNIICGLTSSLSPFVLALPGPYICGDVFVDGIVNILDIVYLINYKYKGGPAPNPIISGNADGVLPVDILDIVWLINYKYKQPSPAPVCL